MNASILAGIVCTIINNADPGDETYVNATDGIATAPETVIEMKTDTFLHVPCNRKPHSAMVEAWINHHYLNSAMVGEGSGHRDHASGEGYGINVHPGSRILVEVYRSGFCLSAVIVRPR